MKMFPLILALLLTPVAAYAFVPFIGGNIGVLAPAPKQVATATYIPNTVSALTTSAIMTRHCHYSRDGISALQLVYAGWAVTPTINNYLGAEISPGNNITYNAWVEYPTGNPVGTTVQATCGGSTTCTATALTNLVTDAVNISIPTNTKFCVWTYEPSGQHIIYTAGYSKNQGFLWNTSCGNACEITKMGTSAVPSSPGSITENQNGKIGITPSAILAQTTIKSTYILSDSRGQGAHETADSTDDLGNIARSLGPDMAYINGGIGGLRASSFYYSNANQLALATLYTTNVVDTLGVNEWVQQTAAPSTIVLSYKEKIAALFARNNMPYVWATIEPVTSTSNACATIGGETVAGYNSSRTSVNDSLRADNLGVGSHLEVANVLEVNSSNAVTQNGGFFRQSAYSDDCLHELAAGNSLIAASGNVTAATVLASTVPTTVNPPATLTLVSPTYDTLTPKFGSGALKTGYGSTNAGVIPGQPPFTIGAWVKYSGTPAAADQWVISVGALSIGVKAANCFPAMRLGDGSSVTSTSNSLCDGSWHWFSATYVPTSTTLSTITLYVDGVTPTGGATTLNANIGSIAPSRFPFAIGTRNDSLGSYKWPGEIDDAAIFYGAITAVPSGAFTGTETGLINAWPLNSSGAAITGPNG